MPSQRLGVPLPEAPLAVPPTPPPGDRPRSDRGLGLLLIFVTATLAMVVAVAVVTVVDRWWVLAPVMLFDFAVTFAVIATIAHLFRDDDEPSA